MKTYLLQVTAGRGPGEACAFVGLLAGRLAELCAARGLVTVRREATGPEGAPRSVAFVVRGPAGALAGEAGTHALFAPSERRGKGSRKRWFAGVSLDELAPGEDPFAPAGRARLRAGDVVVRATRAGGPGGQNVNKVASAVRAEHRATGLQVRAAGERSQHQNRRAALARLEEALTRALDERRAERARALRGRHDRLVRGAPVREYRLDDAGRLRARG
ncbi:MAG TPA: peptide chain release factor-like protein [Polyangiaceae bacterium]|nr:peptide chain release factor-like protein [Polyangiaceae bacterium]